eukprot:CAMPEP_0203668718 /NCGR_PEP_ID=MMETSP0090-20130426/5275_1 /ASSEMBLY_ACC=CAM_ASM_001088 /TAXON_ID=426623 /ORGANISM="Chaetoceros affinis, Strain CCMP159" /LENGTH=474 /DNA_ID=CAMNT_0050533225 /DNA_START=68 /DNA_END=1489 /DNA_ORIENTATION=-
MDSIEDIISNHSSLQGKTVTKISRESLLAQLWAGYGTIHSFSVTFDDKTTLPLVVKRVDPPADGDNSISHLRKLKSYVVEANFYTHIAPILLRGLGQSSVGDIVSTVPLPYSIIHNYQDDDNDDDDDDNANEQMNYYSSPQPPSFQFILSDLSTHYSSSYGSLNPTQTFGALSWLAKFHSTFYQHPLVVTNNDGGGDDKKKKKNKSEFEVVLWPNGGYWHLKTRLDELQSISCSSRNRWSCFHPQKGQLASIIDDRMNHNITKTQSYTLVHGDYKKDNILFSHDDDEDDDNGGVSSKNPTGGRRCKCAVVDFQYCGGGYGAKDIVMLIVSSVSRNTLNSMGGEDGVLSYYYQEFVKYYHLNQNQNQQEKKAKNENEKDAESSSTLPSLESVKKQYELCLLDYVRFMAGWGFWGSNVDYAERRAWSILQQLLSKTKTDDRNDNKKAISVEEVSKVNSSVWKEAIYNRNDNKKAIS